MRTQHIHTQQLPVNFRKFVIIFVTLLAGVNIYVMLDLFLYKGLEFKHYFFMGFPVIVAALGWNLWPKRPKAEPFASTKPMSKADADVLNSLY